MRALGKSRPRTERLYTEDVLKADSSVLRASVVLVGPAYIVDIRYEKLVTDKNGESHPAPTWQAFGGGLHNDAAYIFVESSFSELLDDFLAEYLRVNKPACENR